MPRSKGGTKRDKICLDSLKRAAQLVLKDGISVRAAAKETNIARATLQRRVIAHEKSGNEDFNYKNNCAVRQVFSNEEEKAVTKYLLDASKMHYGLTKRDLFALRAKKLAFEYAQANFKIMPPSCENNREAGEQWFVDFRKRNP